MNSLQHKILVVDNNPVILHLLTRILEKKGHEVQTAEDGLAALEVLRQYQPDVIFTDLIMPNISGDELCRIIRKKEELNDTYLVVLSAVATEDQQDISTLGVDACIAKGPAKEMQQHIEAVLDHIVDKGHQPISKTILGSDRSRERAITRELLATRRHLQVTLENMDDGFLELSRNGRITNANSAAVGFFKQSREKLLGSSLFDFFSNDQLATVMACFKSLQKTPVTTGYQNSVCLDGRHLTIKFIPIDSKEGYFLIALLRDVSRRKQIENELKRHMLELEDTVTERTRQYKVANEGLKAEIRYRKEIQRKLEDALAKVKQLRGFLPICSSCKKIRDDQGYWNAVESYIGEHSEAEFTHSVCPECARNLYPELFKD